MLRCDDFYALMLIWVLLGNTSCLIPSLTLELKRVKIRSKAEKVAIDNVENAEIAGEYFRAVLCRDAVED